MTVWEAIFVIMEWMGLKELNIDIAANGFVCAGAKGDTGEVSFLFNRSMNVISGFKASIYCSMADYEFVGPNADWGFCEFGGRIKNIKELGEVMKVHVDVIDRKTVTLEKIQEDIELHHELFDEARTRRSMHIACLNNFAV